MVRECLPADVEEERCGEINSLEREKDWIVNVVKRMEGIVRKLGMKSRGK